MQRLLYIRLRKEQGFEFGVPEEYKRIKEIFDLDNFSDAQTVNFGLKFLLEAKSCKIIIDAEPQSSFGKLLYLFNQLKEKEGVEIQIIGKHPMLNFLKS